MSRTTAAVAVLILYLLHQDFWWWESARPLVFGVLPIGLAYHVGYMVVTAVVLWALVTYRWPSHLDAPPGSGLELPYGGQRELPPYGNSRPDPTDR